MTRRRVGRGKPAPPVVTASAIGQATFCPYALYLRERGESVSVQAAERLDRGTEAHRGWTASQEPGGLRDGTGGWRAVVVLALVAASIGLVVLITS